MMKLNFGLIIMILSIASCNTTNNSFSGEANKFLDSINNKSYRGENTGAGLTFSVNGQLLATYGSVATTYFDPQNALYFINSRNNGASETEGVYQQNRTPEQYIGIIIDNNGDTLLHTEYSSTIEGINWTSSTKFAQKK